MEFILSSLRFIYSKSQYTYSQLPEPDRSIRILRLFPAVDGTAPLRGQFINYTLPPETQNGRQPYEALSYVWESPVKDHSIFIDNCALHITENLHSALLELRSHQLERLLWIDAICINQDDMNEKSHQIQLMSKIYGLASCVIVWLGKAEDESSGALDIISNAAQQDSPADGRSTALQLSSRDSEAVMMLMKQHWFQRIWVLQEVGLARSIVVMYGHDQINGNAFSLGLKRLCPLIEMPPASLGMILSVTYLIEGATVRPAYPQNSYQFRSIGELLDLYHTRQATMLHDKIYALCGMSIDDPSTPCLIPNYNIPWERLLEEVVKHILSKEAFVQALPNRQVATIECKGVIVGIMNWVETDRNKADRQTVQISYLTGGTVARHYEQLWGPKWTLQTGACPVRQGDIVCYLQGAHLPSIVRLNNDHFTVVLIQARSYMDNKKEIDVPQLSDACTFQHIPLNWNWEHFAGSAKEDGHNPVRFHTSSEKQKMQHCMSTMTNSLISMALTTPNYGKDVVRVLLAQSSPDFVINEPTLKVAASIKNWDYRLLEFLLKRGGEFLPVSEEVLIAAASNKSGGTRILELIFNESGKDTRMLISRRVVEAAAGNTDGVRVLRVLFNKVEGNRDQLISEEAIRTAAENALDGVVEFLFHQSKSLPVSEEVVLAAVDTAELSRSCSERRLRIMKILFSHKGESLPITGKVVSKAVALARREKKAREILWLLFEERGERVPVSEDAVRAAAAETQEDESATLQLLFDQRREKLPVTENVLREAAGNTASRAPEILRLLFEERRDERLVTEEVVSTAAENIGWHGPELLQILFDQRREKLPVTERVVRAAAGNTVNGHECLQILFDRRREELPVTEEVVMAAAGNETKGPELLQFLFELRREKLPVTEGVVSSAAGNRFRGDRCLRILFDQKREKLPVTEEVVKAAAGNTGECGPEILWILSDERRGKLPVTEGVTRAAIGNPGGYGPEFLRFLFDQRREKLPDIERAVKEVAGSTGQYGPKLLRILFDQRREKPPVTKEMVKAAAGNTGSYGSMLLKSLFNQGREELPVTEEMMMVTAGNTGECGPANLTYLFDLAGCSALSEEVVETALKNPSFYRTPFHMTKLKEMGGESNFDRINRVLESLLMQDQLKEEGKKHNVGPDVLALRLGLSNQ